MLTPLMLLPGDILPCVYYYCVFTTGVYYPVFITGVLLLVLLLVVLLQPPTQHPSLRVCITGVLG